MWDPTWYTFLERWKPYLLIIKPFYDSLYVCNPCMPLPSLPPQVRDPHHFLEKTHIIFLRKNPYLFFSHSFMYMNNWVFLLGAYTAIYPKRKAQGNRQRCLIVGLGGENIDIFKNHFLAVKWAIFNFIKEKSIIGKYNCMMIKLVFFFCVKLMAWELRKVYISYL